MRFLCLAYGEEKDWKALSNEQQEPLLRQDEAPRTRGSLMAAVKTDVVTVTACDWIPHVTPGSFAKLGIPLSGFCDRKRLMSMRLFNSSLGLHALGRAALLTVAQLLGNRSLHSVVPRISGWLMAEGEGFEWE